MILAYSLVRYCVSNFVTRALRVVAYIPSSLYLDDGKDCERKTQKRITT